MYLSGIGVHFVKRIIDACLILYVAAPAVLFGQSFNTLVKFDYADGANPKAGMIAGTDGNLYGTTFNGGAQQYGTVFKINPEGALTTVYSFCSLSGCLDGAGPSASLVEAANGDFYGTTAYGGANCADTPFYGCGTIFKITSSGILTTLYDFCSQSQCSDGSASNSQGGLVQAANGDLYGTTDSGGANGTGTVYKITPSGTFTTLYNFCSKPGCADGAAPDSGLIQAADGYLYGTTAGGGAASYGTVFKITPNGLLTTLYSFCSESGCVDGEAPAASLVQGADGDFYGTTQFGGAVCIRNGSGCGTVFKITPRGKLTTLYRFCASGECGGGLGPTAAMIAGTDGNLYGTTSGDRYNAGTVFKITPTGALTTLYKFCSESLCLDGYQPQALVQGASGALYGTTYYGGDRDAGTVFRLLP